MCEYFKNYNFYEDECNNKDLIKDLNGCLNIFIRYCKEKNIYNEILSKTSKKRLLGVLYDMKHWSYSHPCPLQHCYVFEYEVFDDYWLRYLDDFKAWAKENKMKDYHPILNKY